jgi:hypothetical protein
MVRSTEIREKKVGRFLRSVIESQTDMPSMISTAAVPPECDMRSLLPYLMNGEQGIPSEYGRVNDHIRPDVLTFALGLSYIGTVTVFEIVLVAMVVWPSRFVKKAQGQSNKTSLNTISEG